MLVHDHAPAVRLGLDMRIRRAVILQPSVGDGGQSGRQRLKPGKQQDERRETPVTRKWHRVDESTQRQPTAAGGPVMMKFTLSAPMVPQLTQRMAKFLSRAMWHGGAAPNGALSLALLLLAAPLPGQAPAPSAPWRFSAEAGATGGGVWLDGSRVPRVSTGVGFVFATAARRALSDVTGAAAVLRVSMQPLDLRENGVEWNGGTLTEYDLLGVLSIRAPATGSLRATVEAGVGAALLTGAGDIVPFRNASSVAPAGEIGLSVLLPVLPTVEDSARECSRVVGKVGASGSGRVTRTECRCEQQRGRPAQLLRST